MKLLVLFAAFVFVACGPAVGPNGNLELDVENGVGVILQEEFEYILLKDERDGREYKAVQIGEQIWMAENLAYLPDVDRFSDISFSEPRYYIYGYDGIELEIARQMPNYKKYGTLYNWPAAMQRDSSSATIPSGVQGVCPKGWHLPSKDEWLKLELFAGERHDKELKARIGWSEKQTGRDTYGFAALPGGWKYATSYSGMGNNAYWWSATASSSFPYIKRISNTFSQNSITSTSKDYGCSVRCVKD